MLRDVGHPSAATGKGCTNHRPGGARNFHPGDRAALESPACAARTCTRYTGRRGDLAFIPTAISATWTSSLRRTQLKIAESQVAVAGAGGLGGQVILLLCDRRRPVWSSIVDRFDETNLRPSALCSRETLQNRWRWPPRRTVASVNPGVRGRPAPVENHRLKRGFDAGRCRCYR